jgi:Holliday junction resolvase RusA-like endonuclease
VRFREWQEACGPFLGAARWLMISVPVNIEAHYFIGADIKSDLTNYHAALHDMLVHYGVIADDNRLIVASTDGSRVHVDRASPRTEVTITPTGEANFIADGREEET